MREKWLWSITIAHKPTFWVINISWNFNEDSFGTKLFILQLRFQLYETLLFTELSPFASMGNEASLSFRYWTISIIKSLRVVLKNSSLNSYLYVQTVIDKLILFEQTRAVLLLPYCSFTAANVRYFVHSISPSVHECGRKFVKFIPLIVQASRKITKLRLSFFCTRSRGWRVEGY